jgi:aminoglycoside phosphotransferase (APT) family kinase protein
VSDDARGAAETIAVREGEQVDAEALRHWLARTVPALVPAGATLSVRQFPAGYSNLTYLVTLQDMHGERAYVLRRPPRGVKAGVAHDMGREHGILAALHPLGVPVPRPVARCDDETVIGAPFYLMTHVDGVILRGAAPPVLMADADALPARMATISQRFVDTLAQLHAVPVHSEPLASLGRPEGYVQRQVQGWTRRWHASRTTDVPALDSLAAWLAAHQPPERGVTLVHNDFKLDNLVFDPGLSQVRAILDWEMATIGDPLMDLGTTLAYWVEATDAPVLRSLGLGVTALPGAYRRAEVVEAYAAASGRDVQDAAYYFAFGLFKVAIIAQQIFARHVAGLTADARFARLGTAVEALGEAGVRVTETGHV